MNRNWQMIVLTVGLSLTIGTAGISLAAPAPGHGAKGGRPRQEQHRRRISAKRAARIALSRHRHTKVASLKLRNGIYTIVLGAKQGRFILEIEADTGRVRMDRTVRRARPRKPGKGR